MPIPAQQVIDRVRQVGLDAEGADYYDDVIDIIPAINASIEWLTAIISSAFGQKKMGEEVFQDLVQARVFQTNNFSRIFFNSADLGHEVWTILGVYIEPVVGEFRLPDGEFLGATILQQPLDAQALIDFPALDPNGNPLDLAAIFSVGQSVVFTYTDKVTGNVIQNTFTILVVNTVDNLITVRTFPAVLNLSNALDFKDKITAKNLALKISSTPSVAASARPETSVYRPDLAHISSEKSAKRLTIEEWAKNVKNPFRAGNTVLPADCDLIDFAYLSYADYSAPDAPYTVPREIEIRPSIVNDIVTVFYAKKPNLITAGTDTIEFPGFFANWLHMRCLHYISVKQGDQTTLATISATDINNLLQSIT